MTTAAARVLQLLSLLQARRNWSGAELAERLGVDVRTVRRDANRLRDLGYVIESSPGAGGGYRLAAGSRTPPILFSDQEAITVALALGVAAASLGNLSDAALSVLAKLEQLLPARLRRRWGSLSAVTVSLGSSLAMPDVGLLATLASACRDERVVSFRYADRSGRHSLREVEPMRLAHTGRVWYLIAWDRGRADWRTFRIDRIDGQHGVRTGDTFIPRQPPEDYATLASRALSVAPYPRSARVRLRMSRAEAVRRLPAWVGLVEAEHERSCLLTLGGENAAAIAAVLTSLELDFELVDPPELSGGLRAAANRLLAGAGPRRATPGRKSADPS